MAENPEDEEGAVVSTAELAARLGLSRWAVSRALNGKPGISRATAARVRAALAEHNFQPDALARGLRGARSGVVGVVISRRVLDACRLDHNGFHPQAGTSALVDLQKPLSDRGLFPVTVICDGAENEVEAIRRLLSLRVEAVVLVCPALLPDTPAARAIFATKTLFIVVEPDHRLPCPTLRFDYLQAARLVLNHLRQLGHNRLLLFGLPPSGRHAAAYESASADAGFSWRSQIRSMHLDDLQSTPASSFGFGWALAETALRRRSGATALVAADDHIASGALACLRNAGKHVPTDFSIVGYGNLLPAGASSPEITTIEPQTARLFERAADALFEQLDGGGQVETQEILVNPLLHKRASTAPPRRSD